LFAVAGWRHESGGAAAVAVPDDILSEAHALIGATRAACLWFLRSDFLPKDAEGLVRAMQYIERRGNLENYIKARKIREWLSHNSSAISAG